VPYLLRKIRRSKWFATLDWLPSNELQADALGDIRTQNNELSVWLVPDDKSNLAEVMAALSLSADQVSIVEYALIGLDIVSEKGFEIAENLGQTPFTAANHWHRDLVKLSVGKVFELCELVKEAQKERCPDREALNYMAQALGSGAVDVSKISDKLQQSLTKKGVLHNPPAVPR
jgi:hypothetical protein